uniref:sugar ABC transporter permease n=1 Tax=Burkholderia arboris TaxID=488730 RepID=UPI003BEF06E2
MTSELSSSTPATQDADARRSSDHEAGRPAGRSTGSQLRQVFVRYKILALLLAVAAIWAFFSVLTDGAFVTPRNVSNLLRQMSITGMLACGMVFVIIAGEIDLSVGSLLGLLGGVAAILDVNRHWPVAATVPAVLALGVLIGLFNGWWSTYRRVPSFIVGLGGMLAFRGILLGVTGGSTIAPVSDSFVFLGQGYLPRVAGDGLALLLFALVALLVVRQRGTRRRYRLAVAPPWQDVVKIAGAGAVLFAFVATLDRYGGIPVPVLLLLALLGIFSWIATQTVFGRRIYAVGSNLEATRLSGVDTDRVKLAIFALMGLMCAFAGIVNTARLAAGSPSAGTMGELDAIAACFIGGTSMRGGSGTVYGALIGALVMASLDNGMSMLDVDAYWQMIVKGAVLVLAVWIDVVSRSNRR